VRSFALDRSSTLENCIALVPMLLDGQFFSHVTALELHGAPRMFPREVEHVSVAFPRTPPRGEGVIGHSLRRVSRVVEFGLPASDPAFAWCEAAALLSTDQLIATGDALLTGRRVDGTREPGVTSLDELEAAARLHAGSPGIRKLARALSLVRAGVDSPRETFTRLLLLRGGLPEPAVDVPIEVAGGLVLHSDLGYPELRIAIEYDGDGHRTSRQQWQRDVERYELMREAGWTVIRVTAETLDRDPQRLVARVRVAIESRRAFHA